MLQILPPPRFEFSGLESQIVELRFTNYSHILFGHETREEKKGNELLRRILCTC
jgi:hypothetical protein